MRTLSFLGIGLLLWSCNLESSINPKSADERFQEEIMEVTYKDHTYLYTNNGYASSLEHAAHCPNPNHKTK